MNEIWNGIVKWWSAGPYLSHPGRLADVIAAIQVLGTYEYAARAAAKWEPRLARKPRSADTWECVFNQHPEFFTLDKDENTSLLLRRSFTRDFDVRSKTIVDWEQRKVLKDVDRDDGDVGKILTRMPLSAAQLEMLCNLAISLHECEIKHRQERRWWMSAIVTILVAVIAVIFSG